VTVQSGMPHTNAPTDLFTLLDGLVDIAPANRLKRHLLPECARVIARMHGQVRRDAMQQPAVRGSSAQSSHDPLHATARRQPL
jgi:hypothetical protein